MNLAEIEAGLRQQERRKAEAVLSTSASSSPPPRPPTGPAYQAEWAREGRTIETPDALVAGTARAHGAVLMTHNTDDFPMRDVRGEHPDHVDA